MPPRRDNEAYARHPGIHPQLHTPAATGPRREQLALAGQSPGQVPRLLRLHHRHPARRRADPAVPPPLRRLSPLLRLRDLLTRTRPIPRRRPAYRTAHWQPPRALDTACIVHLAGLGHEHENRPRRTYGVTNLRHYYQPERKFLEVLVIHDKITVWHARDGALVKMNASMRSACWNKDIPRCRWPGFSMSPSRRFTAGRKRTAKADWQRYRRR